jgi:nucleoside-diphosphate-sugar epimerase
MKVLVTGGRGFIGRHCLERLLAKGYEVHAVSSSPPTLGKGVHWHQANLLDIAQTKIILRDVKPTHLLHLAWCTEHGKYWTSADNLNWISASLALIREFTDLNGQRLVSAGSCAEYDWAYTKCFESETPCRPCTLYGASKHSVQMIFDAWAKQTGLSNAWGRVFFLYGPGEHPSRLVPTVIQSLLRGKPALCTHGEQVRDFMYVADVAASFVALLERDEVEGAINIASGQAIQLKALLYSIADQLDRRDLVRLGARPTGANEPVELIADVARLRDEVGFRPSYELSHGVFLSIESVREMFEAH